MHRKMLVPLLTVALSIAVAMPVAAQEGGLRYTASVVQFDNEAGWVGQWDVGSAWGTVLTDLMFQSGKFIILGESDMRAAAMGEQDLAASGATAQGSKTPVTGQMTPAQLLVKGAITHVQHNVSGGGGGVRIGGFNVGGGGGRSEINITIYMIDSTTGQVLASKSVVGKSDSRALGVGYNTGGWGASFGGNKDDNLGKAVADAAGQAVDWMSKQLPQIAWRGSVVAVRNGQVWINRGTREGVAVGNEFVVGEVDVLRDPDTGEILDESVVEVARIRVAQVRERIAICDVISGDVNAVAQGQGVQAR